jgi:hypothetical protein
VTDYYTSEPPPGDNDEMRVSHVPNLGTLAMVVVTLGGDTVVDTGPGTTDPPPAAAVGYLWPRGDGTPAAT